MATKVFTLFIILLFLGSSVQAQQKVVPILELNLNAVLGGVSDGRFVDAVDTAKDLNGDESYIVFSNVNTPLGMSVNEYGGRWTAKVPADQPDDICPDYRGVNIDPKADAGIAIGKNADWDAVPRPVTEIFRDNPIYKNAVSKFLVSKGLSRAAVKIEEIYKTDLDGDGTDEVIIRATSYVQFGPSAKKGDYSFVLVRKIAKGKVRDIVLSGDFYRSDVAFGAPNRHKVSAIADLNGDGNMEVVIFGEYYEGSWAEAFKLKGTKPVKVLETGCGL